MSIPPRLTAVTVADLGTSFGGSGFAHASASDAKRTSRIASMFETRMGVRPYRTFTRRSLRGAAFGLSPDDAAHDAAAAGGNEGDHGARHDRARIYAESRAGAAWRARAHR